MLSLQFLIVIFTAWVMNKKAREPIFSAARPTLQMDYKILWEVVCIQRHLKSLVPLSLNAIQDKEEVELVE